MGPSVRIPSPVSETFIVWAGCRNSTPCILARRVSTIFCGLRSEPRGCLTGAVPKTNLSPGISFLAFARLKRYTHLRPTERSFFSARVIGSEPPFQKSSRPAIATAGTGFSRHCFLRGLSWDRFLHRHNRWLYPSRIVRAAIRCSFASISRLVRWRTASCN